MEKFRPSVFLLKRRKSRHQFQINRENQIKVVPGNLPGLADEALRYLAVYSRSAMSQNTFST